METLFFPHSDIRGVTAAIGFFDGVHIGHRALIANVIKQSKERGTASAVVTFVRHPREVLNSDYMPQLINTFTEKCNLLSSTGVDYVIALDFDIAMSQMSGREFIEYLRDNYALKGLFIGYDHRFGHNRNDTFDDYCRYGSELGVNITASEASMLGSVPVSSSGVRRFLLDGGVKQAAAMLSYNYFLSGTVVEGFGIGRTIGFRTANIELNDICKLVPSSGVYAAFVYMADGAKYGAMLNIGSRPTVHNDSERLIEVHIFDFDADIYGKTLTIEFVEFMRYEAKLDGVDMLAKQLADDRDMAKSILYAAAK